MKKVCVFPGQGSQSIGMGRDLYDTFAVAKAVFDEVDDALDFKLSKLIFDGTAEELTQTENAQPALMAMSIAAWRVVSEQTGLKITDFDYAAGHSLGEYSALCAAQALPLSDTARLLRVRGLAMKRAAKVQKGAMAAILGLDIQKVQQVADDSSCFVANDNSVGQVVVSGPIAAVEKACEEAKKAGAKRAIMLNVAGAFHSPLMQPAADEMKSVLADAGFERPKIAVISNVLALPVEDPKQIKELLYRQITGQVRWTETVQYLSTQGVEFALELGAGKVLSGLIKKTAPDIATFNIGDVASLQEFETVRKEL